ncbi:MAG: hypothetical protein AUK44_02480 [Porphyromonadaceae bacterium CG2_30_38_12]|nr:MAG: hypothetical protein AUK44_02480 [Porphyromonadaceae bacterium CG2_30_38_12]
MFYNLKFEKFNRKNLVMLLAGLLLVFSNFQLFAQENQDQNVFEPFNLSIKFEKIGWQDFFVLYNEESSQIYLPIASIFDYLKINTSTINSGKVVEGFYLETQNTYRIDFDAKTIIFGNTTYTLNSNDALYDVGILYVSPTVVEKVFDLKTKFDFRSLSANISTDKELPIVKIRKLEDARNNIKNLSGEINYDKSYPRNYHVLKPGMLDWSIASNQSQTYSDETRAGLALGTEFLGGELSAWLYYSDKYRFNRNQQRYHWRWVDNNFKVVRQFQLGRVYNRSIASLLYPVDGFMITNAPSTVRKALGTYQISENTQPDWVVELYINNVLIDFTKADASGYFSFDVPIVYGSTDLTLRYYGPNGEESSERKTFSMPYNMLPKGEFEYKITGGSLLNGLGSFYGRVETNLGVSKWLTLGAGYEFLNSIVVNPHIPFGNFTLQPFSRLLLMGEYAHKVRYKGTLNYNFANNSMFELNYARYDKNQKAIVYNFLEERMASFSFPTRINQVSALTKATFRQNIYPNFQYNAGELMFSAFYKNFNANLTNYINYTSFDHQNLYSNLALGARFAKGFTIRPSLQYSYSDKLLVYYKAELEKQLFKKGFLTVGYEKNNLVNFESVNLAFRYDFSFMSAYTSAFYNNGKLQTSQSARGSLAFDTSNKYVHFDARDAVGRSGITILPFVDTNFDGKKDANEPYAKSLGVKCNGGKIYQSKKDSLIRIVGLDPFVDYSLQFDESNFENIAWKVTARALKVTTDPNQFKTLTIPIVPLGEVSGTVIDGKGNGVSRILINITNDKGKLEKKVLTESDGFFSYLGLMPGNYLAEVDSIQLGLLNMNANAVSFVIKKDVRGDIVEIENIKLLQNPTRNKPNDSLDSIFAASVSTNNSDNNNNLKSDNKVYTAPNNANTISNVATNTANAELQNNLQKLNTYSNKNNADPERLQNYDSLLNYSLLYDFNKPDVRTEFYGSLKELGKILKENPDLKLEIHYKAPLDKSEFVNKLFSEHRANSVQRILTKFGISPKRIVISGFDEPKSKTFSETIPKTTAYNKRVVFKDNSEKERAKIDSITRKSYESFTNSDLRTLKKSFKYDTSDDIFEVKWNYIYSIYYEPNRYNIRPSQQIVLNALAAIMKKNPCLNINLSSHTDSVSTEEHNMELSKLRSGLVWDALVKNDIERTRIEAINYGELKPFNNNANKAERAVNRRVLFQVAPTGCQLNLDSLITSEILNSYETHVSSQIIIQHDGRYMLQTGLFKSEQFAILMAIKLNSVVPNNIYIIEEKGFYRVIVGYTKTRKEAMNVARIIQATGVIANPIGK